MKVMRFGVVLLLTGIVSTAEAMTAQIEVGSGTLPATLAPGAGNPSVFTTINFDAQFAVAPNVFVMTEENALNVDPCTIRIRNVTTTSFDATCLEPINENRATGGMIFEYIAVQNGTTTVPLVGGGGNVNFVSACSNLTNQQYGPNCTGCSGAQSYSPISFPPGFTAAPALLTQVQTTNNIVSADPIFIDTAVRQGSLSSAGFDLALDQMEAGTGPIASSERVCYLAVERNGCENLDFSGIGGPASVTFQAQTGGNNVDGHDNGCTSGEGVTFAPACFTAAPIAVAKQITRNGNNGGFIRRCSVSASEVILTFDEDAVSDGERNHINETASVLAFSSAFTTPVTFSKALVTLKRRQLRLNWETSAETFHLGFDVWAEIDGQWSQLNRKLIVGSGRDSTRTKSYHYRVKLDRDQANKATRFAISSLDSQGIEDFFGPFEIGIEYGASSAMESIDWTEVSATHNRTMQKNGYRRTAKGWRKHRQDPNDHASQYGILEVEVEKPDGIHMISGDQILVLAPHLEGTPLKRLALTLNGTAVARHIESADRRLSRDDRLFFVAKAPQDSDAIYLNSYMYRLSIDRHNAIDATRFDAQPIDHYPTSVTGARALRLTDDKQYSASNAGATPWFDQSLLAAGGPKSVDYIFDFADAIDSSQMSTLTVSVSGGIDFPAAADDHHLQLSINNTLLYDARFDGFTENSAVLDIPADTLRQTGNLLTVRLPGDTGYVADLINIDDLVVTAHSPLAQFTALDIALSTNPRNYQWNVSEPIELALAYTPDGGMSVLENIENDGQSVRFSHPVNQPRQGMKIAMGAASAIANDTQLSLVEGAGIPFTGADYMIVSHPNFIGEKLSEFVSLKQEQGFIVQVVDWYDIVAEYGGGNETPTALRRFAQAASKHTELSHLLIVGGHSVDYRGLTDAAVTNFIPSFYRPVNILAFSPTDNPVADTDGDQRPDIAVGRWPVRSNDDLNAIVNKTTQWHLRRSGNIYQNALLVAQAPDNRGLDFTEQIFGRVALPMQALAEFQDIDLLDMAQLSDAQSGDPVKEAQQAIREAISNGLDVLSFAGHASTASWGFQGIVNTDFIRSLDNVDNPLVVMPLACYTTNFEALSVNTLAHQWMFAGDQGAVAIHGASVLGSHRENAIFAERFLLQAREAKTYGEAIQRAKQQMSSYNSMLNNWVLLGDPGLPLH